MRTTRTIAASAVLATALSATVLASADAAPRPHHSPARAGAYQVTIDVDKTQVEVGQKVRISGKVSPGAAGDEVRLQVKYEGRKSWKTIDTTTLTGPSRYRFKDKVGSVRYRKYRVVKPAGEGHAAGRATTRKVTVFGWRTLTSLDPAAGFGIAENQSVGFGGVSYPYSLRSYPYGPQVHSVSIEYNLNRACKAFRGTAGLDDSSPTGSSTVIALATDGNPRYSRSFGLTESAPVAFDVTQVFRLSIAATNSGGGLGAVGTPQVLCSF